MVLPIIGYGDPVLRKVGEEIEENDPQLKEIIKNMWDTMYNANGVGLAAPQVGKSLRLFVVDASTFEEEEPDLANFKKVFINPIILEETGKEWSYNEGCLSIPGIREDVDRKPVITIEYYNEKWELLEETYTGMAARIIQHEYDHIEGKLFTDHLPPLKKKLLKPRLDKIIRGQTKIHYKMKFFNKK
jgi:peptide deformylase